MPLLNKLLERFNPALRVHCGRSGIPIDPMPIGFFKDLSARAYFPEITVQNIEEFPNRVIYYE